MKVCRTRVQLPPGPQNAFVKVFSVGQYRFRRRINNEYGTARQANDVNLANPVNANDAHFAERLAA